MSFQEFLAWLRQKEEQKKSKRDVLLPSYEGDRLREDLNVTGLGPFYPQTEFDKKYDLPQIEIPPQARRPTTVIGTDIARNVESLYKVAPQLRGRASVVRPMSSGFINYIIRRGEPEYLNEVGGLNLLGIYRTDTDEIGLDPTRKVMETIGHEYNHLTNEHKRRRGLPHSTGFMDEALSRITGDHVRKYFGREDK